MQSPSKRSSPSGVEVNSSALATRLAWSRIFAKALSICHKITNASSRSNIDALALDPRLQVRVHPLTKSHDVHLSRYVVLNPVRAQVVAAPDDWPWSSYRATTGEVTCPDWLRRDWLLSAFDSTEQAAVAAYRCFVAEGIGQPGPWEQLRHQVFLGSEPFGKGLRQRQPQDRDLSEVPRAERRSPPKPLDYYVGMYPIRDEAIAAAYASGGYTLKEIGDPRAPILHRVPCPTVRSAVGKD